MNKIILLALIIGLCKTTMTIAEIQPEPRQFIKLDNSIIHLLDGIPFALDDYAIRDILTMIIKIESIQYGKRRLRDIPAGYQFGNKELCLRELVLIEQDLERKGIRSGSEHARLQQCLNWAIQDFINITFQFMGKIQNTKRLIINLMREECVLRDNPHSFILTWANTNGDEEQVFRAGMTSLTKLDTFFTDLTNFLIDFMYSCPKGCKMFKKQHAKLCEMFTKFYPEEGRMLFAHL